MKSKPKGNYMPHEIPGLRPRKLPHYARRPQPDTSDGCMVLFILFVSLVFSLTATKCAGQPATQFRSLFQVEHTESEVVLYHAAYNLTVDAAGVECVPVNPAAGVYPAIPVTGWKYNETGDWQGKAAGGAVILHNAGTPGVYLEIIGKNRITFFYNQAPARLVLDKRDKG